MAFNQIVHVVLRLIAISLRETFRIRRSQEMNELA